jgi:hypothetical protein
MANNITFMNGGSYQSAVTRHGVGGFCYWQLRKGTPAYTNGINQVHAVRNAATSLGIPYRVSAVTTIHGEADQIPNQSQCAQGSASLYESYLVQWQLDYETDVRAITGQVGAIPMFTDQMSSWTYTPYIGTTTPGTSLGQLAAAENNPGRIYLVGPKYQFTYADGVHLTNVGYRRLGEYYGKVMKRVLIDGIAWKPLSPTSVIRTANVITATFHVPVLPLQFDITLVLPKANQGFEYFDDSPAPPTITNVQIAGNSVQITLSHTPTGSNQRLRYAYTGTVGQVGADQAGSPRGNLRDSDNTSSLYGSSLYNWAVTFDKPVTGN